MPRRGRGLTHAQRNRLLVEAAQAKTPAERETERRIREMNRRLYPLPPDEPCGPTHGEPATYDELLARHRGWPHDTHGDD